MYPPRMELMFEENYEPRKNNTNLSIIEISFFSPSHLRISLNKSPFLPLLLLQSHFPPPFAVGVCSRNEWEKIAFFPSSSPEAFYNRIPGPTSNFYLAFFLLLLSRGSFLFFILELSEILRKKYLLPCFSSCFNVLAFVSSFLFYF